MSLKSGERQVAPTREGIRRDHVSRYEFAREQLKPGSKVVDLACGVGYGSDLLASAGHKVTGIDINREAIAYAAEHYAGNGARFVCASGDDLELKEFDAVVSFETIEHVRDPVALLRGFRKAAPRLIASVPNEEKFPFTGQQFHFRHYTKSDFEGLLLEAGWKAVAWFGQEGPHSEVEPGMNGRTLIVVAEHCEPVEGSYKPAGPKHVSIVGLGPSAISYMELVKRLGDPKVYCDEVWAINAMAPVIQCDRVFHMDDMAVQEMRTMAKPDGNIAAMTRWMKTCHVPVITSIPRYPGHEAFPLEAVLNGGYDNGGVPYFNSTAAYAVAYAIHLQVKQISLFGIDYTLPNVHSAEQGRACVEFWLGIATARGIEITIPENSSLLDACAPEAERLYGYDLVDVSWHDREEGGVAVKFAPKKPEDMPTAEAIERRYDHKRHPNRLVQKETGT